MKSASDKTMSKSSIPINSTDFIWVCC